MKNPFLGTGIAIITPFKTNGEVDHDALTKIVEFNIKNGVDYIVISGTTGESVTITKQEKRDIIVTISKANNGRLPLVLGIGGNNTAEVIKEIESTDLTLFSGILQYKIQYSYFNRNSTTVTKCIIDLFSRRSPKVKETFKLSPCRTVEHNTMTVAFDRAGLIVTLFLCHIFFPLQHCKKKP